LEASSAAMFPTSTVTGEAMCVDCGYRIMGF
jgi:enoyl-[acyl-carrier-protein] reductase (NADH)